MASKKTTTTKAPQLPPRPSPATCPHVDKYGASAWTSYGIPQPSTGEVFQVCQFCGDTRTLPDERNPKQVKETPKYIPPVIEGYMVSLWADIGFGLTDKERKKQSRAQFRKEQRNPA